MLIPQLQVFIQIKKGGAIDKDHRVTKQQYTTLLSIYGIGGGRETRCVACQQKKFLFKLESNVSGNQFDQIWQNFATGKFWTVYFLFGKILSLLWQICDILGLIFIVANGQILKNNLIIWSHWWQQIHHILSYPRKN